MSQKRGNIIYINEININLVSCPSLTTCARGRSITDEGGV